MQSGLIVPQSKHLLEILAVFAPQWAVQQLNRLLFGAVPREHTVDVPPRPVGARGGRGCGVAWPAVVPQNARHTLWAFLGPCEACHSSCMLRCSLWLCV